MTMMDETRAEALIAAVGGEVFETEEGLIHVVIVRPDGRLVVFTEVSVDEYADWDAFREGACYSSIGLV